LLIALLDDPQDSVPDHAAAALGQLGALSRAAVPKLLPMLKAKDKDLRHAATIALRQIDPEAAAKAAGR
jgi:HEAT repeat protein